MGSNNRQKTKTGRTFVQCRTFSCRGHPLTRSAPKRAVLRQYPAVLNRRRHALDRAVATALERGSCHPETVRVIIEERRREQGLPPLSIADDGRGGRGTTPRGTALDAYDRPEASARNKT